MFTVFFGFVLMAQHLFARIFGFKSWADGLDTILYGKRLENQDGEYEVFCTKGDNDENSV